VANRVAIFLLCLAVLLVGPAAAAHADAATQLPFPNGSGAWLVVDPAGGHVFVSGGPGTSSIVVLSYSGTVVKTIPGEGGASGMALNPATHTLYVALHDAGEISEINTQTLTETRRFSTTPHSDPSSLVIAGGKLWFSCFQSNGQGCLVSANLDGSGMATPIPGFSFATLLAAGGSGGNLLAIGDSYQAPPTISVYNVAGGVPSLVSTAHPNDGEVASMTFDPSGAKLLLATGAPYYIQSLATNTLLPSGAYPTGPYPVAVAVTANGKYVAGGVHTGTGTGNDVFVYPVGSTTPVRTWHIGDGTTELPDHSLAFSPDASRLFAVAQDSATGHLAFHVLDQPTVPLKATTISMGGSARSVRYGSHASLTVHVSGTATGKVDLYATPNGGHAQFGGRDVHGNPKAEHDVLRPARARPWLCLIDEPQREHRCVSGRVARRPTAPGAAFAAGTPLGKGHADGSRASRPAQRAAGVRRAAKDGENLARGRQAVVPDRHRWGSACVVPDE
jgi:DNA-binding beta-propeller fold protein YncE